MTRPDYNSPDYRAARETLQYLRATGTPLVCRRCHEEIRPGQPMDTGHPDPTLGTHGYGPEHSTCNRSAGGKAGAATRARMAHPLAL